MEVSERKGRIVIVEDEAVIAIDLQERLTSNGYEVVELCPTGEDALRVLPHANADLVLMDVHLPGHIDGIEASRRASVAWQIPTVYLTAYSDNEQVSRAARTSPLGYLVKPVRDRELFAAIEVALHRSRLNRRLQVSDQWLAETLQPDVLASLVFDPQGKVLYADVRCEQFLHFTRGELLDMSLADIITIRGMGSNLPLHMRATADAGGHTGIGDVHRSDGTTCTVAYAMAPMVDSGGRHLGLMLTLRSVDSGVDPGTLPVTITAPVIRASAGLTRIAVLSGDPIFRRGILDVVRVSSLVRIVMDARQMEELGTPGLAKEVDVVLVDAGQYDEAPASMWAAIDAIGEAVPLLFVSSRAEGAAIQEAAWRGHSCLLLTIDHSGPLVRACADVAAGKGFVSPVFLPYVRKGSTEPRSRDLRDRLSERERVVLLGIQVGKPLKTIAAELQVSTKTISTYRRRVLAKLGLRSNAELVLYPSRQKPS